MTTFLEMSKPLSEGRKSRIDKIEYMFYNLQCPIFSAKGGSEMSQHPIVHVEFSALDREAAGQFYADLFGWKVNQMPEMDYATFESQEGFGGGLNPVSDNYPAGTVTVYVATEDIDATLAKAEALGGATVMPKSEIPGVGWFGMFTDPTGNLIGLLTSLEES
jgi:predicted enzyme related to lactoylglutathione lyase